MKKILTLCFLFTLVTLANGEQRVVTDMHTANVDGLAAGGYYKETHSQEPQDIREVKINKPLGQDKGETVRVNINTPEVQMRREAARGFDTKSPTKVKAGTEKINAYLYNKNGKETIMNAGIYIPPVSEAVDATYEDDSYARERKVHLKDYDPEKTDKKGAQNKSEEKTKLEEARERFRRSLEEKRRQREEQERARRERNKGTLWGPREQEQQEQARLGEPEQSQQEQAQEPQPEPQPAQPQPAQKKRKGAWRTPKSTGPRPPEQPKEEPTLPHTTYEEIFVGTSDPEFLHNFISQYLSPIAADDFTATAQAAVYHPEEPPQLSGFFVPGDILRDAIGNYERELRESKRREEERRQKEQQRKQQLHNDSTWNNHAGINKILDTDKDKNGRLRYECTRSNQLSSDYNCSRCCKLRETDYSSDSWPSGFDARMHKMLEGQLRSEGGNQACWCYWEAKRPDVCDPQVKISSDAACAKCCDALLDADHTLHPSHITRANYAEHNSRVEGNECLCQWLPVETKRAIEEEARQEQLRRDEEVRRRNEEWNRQREQELQWAREEQEERDRQRRLEREREEREEEARRRQQQAEWEREEQERQRRIEQEQREYEAQRERERLEQERRDEEYRQRRAWEQEVENARARMTAEELEEWIRRNIPW